MSLFLDLDIENDGIIWTKKVHDPSAFGVVKTDERGIITDFVEKPQEFISDLAIIGIYYFQDGTYLKNELQYLIDNNIRDRDEFQLTDALENMKNKGTKFVTGEVSEWLDCGNKNATVHTNQRYLEYLKDKPLLANTAKLENTVLIPPVYIGENVELYNAVVGPHVSIGDNSQIRDAIIKNTIIQENTKVENVNLQNSMLGNFVEYQGKAADLSLGDYTQIKE